jgi:protein-disulfide isomerase
MSTNDPKVTLQPAVGDDDHVEGRADAPVTLVEYGDYQCPYCGRAHPVVTALRARLGDRLRFVFRNFPLTDLHPHAFHAALAAESVGAHAGADAFWAMHDTIFEHQRDSAAALDDAHLLRYAVAAGVDAERVRADIAAAAFEDRIRGDFMSGVRSGVNGTPTFFINGVRYDGDWTNVAAFAAALERAASSATVIRPARRLEREVQAELQREAAEGADAIGDVAANRTVTGSSTWTSTPASRPVNGPGIQGGRS